MKNHTYEFKQETKNMGRQLKATITYNNTTLEEEIYSVTPHYKANLLKSVMKQLDLETSVEIPLNTVINCKIGIYVDNDYEMLDYGNYVVYKVEKQEDTDLYKITCFDKMLYAMKTNEDLQITYPITIKNYLIAIGNKIGLEVQNTNFYNYNMQIPSELYLGLDYTYRDILDEIAQVSGGMIIINDQDKLEVKYPTETQDTINEEFLKDVNVDFGQKYGPINSIVLSRAGESDNVYIQDEESITENGLTEVKIVDNQIMNFNNRSGYLQGILNALNGLYYYINDFSSTGILYYDVGDLYDIEIGENTYKCLMLNDEINITSGIEEQIYTDMPEQSETDYTKADKTDRRINETYLIVDKQNQAIEGVITNVSEQNTKIATLRADVDEIKSEISDIAGLTVYGESNQASVSLENINQSEPIMIKIQPILQNISYLYPRNNLYPSNTLFMPNRIIRFIRTYDDEGTTKTQNIDYELPADLLYYNSEIYDEFYLNYESRTCQVTKRCGYNADGTVYALDNEIIQTFSYPTIQLDDGDYQITIPGYTNAYLYVKLMAKNLYTDQFATRAELNSSIEQTTQNINLSVNQKLTNYSTTNQMNSAINLKANEITSSVSQTYSTKTELNTAKSEIKQTTDGISSEVSRKVGNNEVISKINQSSEAVTINANKVSLNGKTINLTSDNIAINSTNFSVDKNGNLNCNNATISKANVVGGKISLSGGTSANPNFEITSSNSDIKAYITPNSISIGDMTNYSANMSYSNGSFNVKNNNGGQIQMTAGGSGTRGNMNMYLDNLYVVQGNVHANAYLYDSLESIKKNINKYDKSALDIIKKSNVYEYNYKIEKDGDKKTIGFVIGDEGNNYNTPEEILSKDKKSINSYSAIGILWKAIQEQQEQIKILKNKIKKLEKGEKNG